MARSKAPTPRASSTPAVRRRARLAAAAQAADAAAARVLAPEPVRPVHRALAVAVFCLAAYLCLKSLGATYFWDDESHVGIFARNLIRLHEATGWDGRNLVAGRNGTVLDARLHSNFSPLQDYFAAASFLCFGQSAGTARLPFALLGIGSLALFAFILWREFPGHAVLRLYAFSLAALSTNYLLSARQCRYYMLSAVLGLTLFLAYRLALESRRIRWFLLFAAAGVLGFYANFLIGSLPLLAAGVVHLALYRRDLDRRAWLRLGVALGLAALAVVPYAVARRVWHRPDIPVQDHSWVVRRATLLWWHLRDMNAMNIAPWPLALVAAWPLAFLRRGEAGAVVRRAWEWIAWGAAYVVLLVLLTPQPVSVTRYIDERYLIPFLPVLVLAPALGLWFVHKRWPWGRFVAPALLLAAVSSSVLTLAPSMLAPPGWRAPVWRLPALAAEVHRPYLTAQEAACQYLREHARQDDVVLADPDFMSYPLMFHVGDYVRIGCLLTEDTPLGAANVRARTAVPGQPPAPLFIDTTFPDWIVCFLANPNTEDLLRHYQRPHSENGRTVAYAYPLADTLDVYGFEANRPEFGQHEFGPKRNFDKRWQAVYIFRKTGGAAPAHAANSTPSVQP